MNILKKDGRVEQYSSEKAINSIKNSATDCGLNFNESDLELICKEIKSKIKIFTCDDTRMVSSIEMKYITYLVLTDLGFEIIAENYKNL